MMQEMFADLHVHIGRSEKGKPIKITAARSLNFANIAKECAERKGIQIVGIIDCASPYVIEDIEEFLKTGEAYEIKDGGIIYKDKVCIILGSEIETSEINDNGKTGIPITVEPTNHIRKTNNKLLPSDFLSNSPLFTDFPPFKASVKLCIYVCISCVCVSLILFTNITPRVIPINNIIEIII